LERCSLDDRSELQYQSYRITRNRVQATIGIGLHFCVSMISKPLVLLWREAVIADGETCATANFDALARSPWPREKKKLAPSFFLSYHIRATVRDTVDFPVAATPLSQKMQASYGLPDQRSISKRRPYRVPSKQFDSCCHSRELNAAPFAEFALALQHGASQLKKTASEHLLAYQNLPRDLRSYGSDSQCVSSFRR